MHQDFKPFNFRSYFTCELKKNNLSNNIFVATFDTFFSCITNFSIKKDWIDLHDSIFLKVIHMHYDIPAELITKDKNAAQKIYDHYAG